MLKKKIIKNFPKNINNSSLLYSISNEFFQPESYQQYDFNELALNDTELSKYIFFNSQGMTTIDWKNPSAVKTLTKSILIQKIGLKYWDIPSNNLCPIIPSRINYIKWINTLILDQIKNNEIIIGIDIGTGANLIYPILGYKIYKWQFIGTEIDEISFENANKIINENKFNDKIEVRLSKGTIFKNIVNKNENLTFSMCNPPFFNDIEEQKKVEWRTSELKKNEGEIEGGEIEFVKKMFEESLEYISQIKIFSSLIGKKRDLIIIKNSIENRFNEIKKEKKINEIKIFTKTFYQGKNARWAIAWVFN